jgi:hypothetical protein
LEAARQAQEEALVGPETLLKMAAVYDAECARVREKLMSDGPYEPAASRSGVESEVRAILRQKLLRDDPPQAERARA